MAKSLKEWVASDVKSVSKKQLKWLSEYHFFRDPARPVYTDPRYFFAPADGVILYQRVVEADEALVEIKGRAYTPREALRDKHFNQRCLVIGIFMSIYDVHINRIPYAGVLNFTSLPAIETYNRPMLSVEEALLRGHAQPTADADYLFSNQRMLNRVYIPSLGISYHLLQIADYDVATILPFEQRQNRPVFQNQRFSQIRFGSQVDLILPVSSRFEAEILLPDTCHVEAGIDPLLRIAY